MWNCRFDVDVVVVVTMVHPGRFQRLNFPHVQSQLLVPLFEMVCERALDHLFLLP